MEKVDQKIKKKK